MKKNDPQQNFFQPREDTGKWKPPVDLPDLSSAKTIWMDNETTGNNKRKDVPVGIAIATEDRSWYLPFAHEGGGNLDEEAIKRWCKDQLRNKRLANINMGFDAETCLNWGVDLEAQGCMLHDVAHSAALIDEKQFKGPNLDDLAAVYIPGRKKLDSGIPPKNIHKVHSSLIGPYAMNDVEMARDVDIAQRPMIVRDRLEFVEALEDELIWPNNSMERNGMRLDMEKLARWREEVTTIYGELNYRIWLDTGVKLKPNSAVSWHELFNKIGLDRPKYRQKEVKKSKGKPYEYMVMEDNIAGYTDSWLKPRAKKHELVAMGLRMRRLSSLKTKYLDKYWNAQVNGILYYNLYQLRSAEEDYGTVVGRYSSANVNIQQVFKCENQIKRFGDEFIIRELMIPDDGYDLFAVDGSQLQFREFAHYSNDPQLISAYRDNPDTDFHQMVADLFHLDRQNAKHNNFAKVLGMGNERLANRLDKSCTCHEDYATQDDKDSWWKHESEKNRAERDKNKRLGIRGQFLTSHVFAMNENHDDACPAREANDLSAQYDADFPAARKTMEAVTTEAKGEGKKGRDHAGRGYIQSLSGRRCRFDVWAKHYSAFAALLQMGEADIVKSKINTLYKMRKQLGIKMRAPVHDEVVGDIERDLQHKKMFEDACNHIVEERMKMKVPMVWEAKYGKNWKDMFKEKK